MAAMRAFFAEQGHRPSADMWGALQAVAETMEKMAEGRCPPVIHVSSLDPGVGKTTTVICFLRALLGSQAHSDVAALVCVRRKDQIEAIVKEADLSPSDFAVLTADPELNRLGSVSPSRGRVLFTTHAMIEKRCDRTGSFFQRCRLPLPRQATLGSYLG
jgi:DNA polymerase III delta prime subunit